MQAWQRTACRGALDSSVRNRAANGPGDAAPTDCGQP